MRCYSCLGVGIMAQNLYTIYSKDERNSIVLRGDRGRSDVILLATVVKIK